MMDTKIKRYLTTVMPGAWWISDKIETHRKKKRAKRAKRDADVIDNLERLHRLRERGAITEADFDELKAKLKAQI